DQSSVAGGSNITSYDWNFGDGQTSIVANPQRSYSLPGIYDVRLIVGSGEGCLDTTNISATVYPNPEPDFSSVSACENDEASFQNLSTIDGTITADLIDLLSWNFGDNSSGSSDENPGHIYLADGTYQVTLTATSNKGCDASITHPIIIYPAPDAPTAVEDTACFGYPAFLIAQPPAGQGVSHIDWFTDAVSSSPFETNFTFVTPPLTSTQTYYLEAVSGFGCRSSRVEINAYTHDESLGRLMVNDTILEIPQAIAEFAIIGGSPISSYEWNFGDGSTSTDVAPVHQYKNAGKYLVTLDYLTENGCEGQFFQEIEVKEIIVVSIPSAFSPNGDGVNDFFYIGSNLITEVDFKVYNRWGELVYQSQNPDFKWDGFGQSGKRLTEGVYVYLFDGVDIQGRPIEKTGTISLFK
ncbi:MAG: PKD domain-containing protein, partial [Bacteroidota bacterium]